MGGYAQAIQQQTDSGGQQLPIQIMGAVGAGVVIKKPSLVLFTAAGVATVTLAAPVAGTDDGQVMEFVDTTGHAHTITVGAGLINGAAAGLATFAGAKGDGLRLIAYNGVWYTLPTTANVVIS